jgi:polar amino acid transport system permease protein
VVGDYLNHETIIDGAANTLWITLVAMLHGVVLGLGFVIALVN